MIRILVMLCAWLVFLPLANANLLSELQSGSSLIIMRHADAPGISDPPAIGLGIARPNAIWVRMVVSKPKKLVPG